eukprot:COSAG02_NODE_54410_length_296_cov_0.781726_1_plen_32_part_01
MRGGALRGTPSTFGSGGGSWMELTPAEPPTLV